MPRQLINLARALKLKNRVVQRLSQLDHQIINSNSMLEGNHEFDIPVLFKSRLKLAEQLVQLKTSISQANQPIQQTIFELAECKSLIAMLNKINTKHGTQIEGYSGVKTNYVAQIRQQDVIREVRRVEREIDRLQNLLDEYNFKTMIEVDEELMKLGESLT